VIGDVRGVAPISVHDIQLPVTFAEGPEGKMFAVGRPDGETVPRGVVREICQPAPIRIHDIDLEGAAAI